jgi:hypothetical protein
LAIHSVKHATLHQQAAAAELNFNALLVSNFGLATDIVNMEHGAWEKAAGVAEIMTKDVARGYTGGVRTTQDVWDDLIILKWVQLQNAIRGTTFMKWPGLAVQVKDFTLSVTQVTKVTSGTWVIDIVHITASMPVKALAQAV